MGLKELVGIRIRQARREKNWNQQRLADEVGIGQPTIAAYETGRVNLPLDTLERIAIVLQKPIEYFVTSDYQYTVKAPLTRGNRDEQQAEYNTSKKAGRQRSPAKTSAR